MHIAPWKEPVRRGHTRRTSKYRTFWKTQDSEKIRGRQGRGKEGAMLRGAREVQGIRSYSA